MIRSFRSLSLSRTASRRHCCPPRALCSTTAATPKETLESSSSADSTPNVGPPTSATSSHPPRTLPPLLKFGLFGAAVGALASAGYATYAYTTDEIDEKTKPLRSSIHHTTGDNVSGIEKFQNLLYSAVIAVPAKAVDLYLDLRRSIEEQVQGFTEPSSDALLPDLHPLEQGVFTLVLDLKDTLVYTEWTREKGWFTFKRPGVDSFLEHLAQFYEIVVYSDEQSMYVEPVMERLDGKGCVRYRLSRTATKYQNGKHYRDLSKLNRDPARIIYLSAHALESTLQPENSVPIKPWKKETDDTALIDLIPFLEFVARHRPADIRPVLASYEGKDIATEFIARSKEHQRRMAQQKQQGSLWRRQGRS